ncbi:hypothetical protein [Paenibacillus apiarius]|uniref:Uncharacterized protein n=1 Tax=Paenibacillus apiarius TaxID=46240 RepID=A0ABT4DX73_9BACL|nr:hypothetical protein [Paenibacillus apiarius]MBN3527437.1 hypothetical protein [Paenibacillus apiarius]MCY9515953.1 hypothetical protein [Paenibacillus apiarius]MCY9520863.1 hypothetical protein [Paenibacillus apiarius]MCY9553568.1 hypothetical protein [Paenibacillus apiarius]MCY9557909.1 hypothetical protein [Paenibacillus apiarius]
MPTLINYNRAILSNLADSSDIILTDTPTLLLEFGLSVTQTPNFVELLSTVGWTAESRKNKQPTLQLRILQDGVLVASIRQDAVDSEEGSNSPSNNLSTFQAVLTNVPVNQQHVYQLFALNENPRHGSITVTGPVNITGKVIA